MMCMAPAKPEDRRPMKASGLFYTATDGHTNGEPMTSRLFCLDSPAVPSTQLTRTCMQRIADEAREESEHGQDARDWLECQRNITLLDIRVMLTMCASTRMYHLPGHMLPPITACGTGSMMAWGL